MPSLTGAERKLGTEGKALPDAAKYYKTEGLSYIGPDDWECRAHVDDSLAEPGHELMVARMSHGTLAVEYRFDSGGIVPMKFTVRSRSRL